MGISIMALYPIYFTDNTCIRCGKKGCLRYLDNRGHVVKDAIYPVSKIVCKNCGETYYINWIKEDSNHIRPICVDKSYMDSVESNMETYAQSHRRCMKIY